MFRVGPDHTFIGIYGVYTVFMAGTSPYMQSYTVCIYGSGQPYNCCSTCTVVLRIGIKLTTLLPCNPITMQQWTSSTSHLLPRPFSIEALEIAPCRLDRILPSIFQISSWLVTCSACKINFCYFVWFKVTVQHQSGFTTYRNKKKVAALQSVCANLDQQAKQALTSLRSRQPKPQETWPKCNGLLF